MLTKRDNKRWRGPVRRLLALCLAAGTLWTAAVTCRSESWAAALSALRTQAASPLRALRWELGDLWTEDGLSPATVMTLSESPLLLSARAAVLELWSSEAAEPTEPEGSDEEKTPVEETPLETLDFTDNGIPARTLVPTSPAGYTVVGNVYISNSTDHALDAASLQGDFDACLTGEEPQVLILHTHGSEAYTLPPDESYVASGNHRTTDTNYNMVRVGDEMAEVFGEAGISVLHDRTLYDYPNYSGAYDRSLAAINSYLEKYPSIRFILDVHRDAIEDSEGNEYKVVSPIEGVGTAAQITLVVGSDGSGLPHPNWKENLKLAVAIQENIIGDYPSLMRPLVLRNSRYNQHVTTGSLLVEMGAAGNSLDEALLAARLFTEQMIQTIQAKEK